MLASFKLMQMPFLRNRETGPRRRGVVDIASASGTNDRGSKARKGESSYNVRI
jgi:hypothetical protein